MPGAVHSQPVPPHLGKRPWPCRNVDSKAHVSRCACDARAHPRARSVGLCSSYVSTDIAYMQLARLARRGATPARRAHAPITMEGRVARRRPHHTRVRLCVPAQQLSCPSTEEKLPRKAPGTAAGVCEARGQVFVFVFV